MRPDPRPSDPPLQSGHPARQDHWNRPVTGRPAGQAPASGPTATPVGPWSVHRYEEDLYFRESHDDAWQVLGPAAEAVLARIALLTVKPDAVVGRRMGLVIDYLLARGFAPVAARRVGFSRHSMRELWRHDWTVYPTDRLAFSTLWYTSCDVLLLLLEDTTAAPGGPAAADRLAGLKGSAIASQRRPTDLRSVLRPPNRVLNFVHAADTTADVIREVGVFCDRAERQELYRDLAAGRDALPAARRIITALEVDYPAHDLDAVAAIGRLVVAGAVTACGGEQLSAALASGRHMAWADILALVDCSAPGADRWDLIAVASRLVPPDCRPPGTVVADPRRRAGAGA